MEQKKKRAMQVILPSTILSYCDTLLPDWLSTPPVPHLKNPPSTAEINNMKTLLSSRKAPGLDNHTPSSLKPVFAANPSPNPTGPTPILACTNATSTTANAAGMGSSAPGPGYSGLTPIDADTNEFDENLLSVSATPSVPGTSTPTPLSLSTAPLSTVATYFPLVLLSPHKPFLSPASPPLPTLSPLLPPLPPSYSFVHKRPQSWFYKPDPKISPVFHGPLGQDLVARPLSLSLCHTTTLTTLYPSVRAPDKTVLPTRPLLTSPTGGDPPKKVISITLMVDTSLLNVKHKRFHEYCIRVYKEELPRDF